MSAGRTPYQDKIIKRYYNNREDIGLQKAQEAVTELYLAEGKKRLSVWKRLASHLEKCGVKPERIAELQAADDAAAVAALLEKMG